MVQALQACAQDALLLGTFNSWLLELVGERSDANLHVLRKLLEVLQKLPAASYTVLQAAGLLVSLDKACKHRQRDVAQTATSIAKVSSNKQQRLVGGSQGELVWL